MLLSEPPDERIAMMTCVQCGLQFEPSAEVSSTNPRCSLCRVVTSPPHYTQGGVEVIDIIRAKLTTDEFHGYCKGNVLKYIFRANLKGGVTDLRKAKVYLQWLIDDDLKHE